MLMIKKISVSILIPILLLTCKAENPCALSSGGIYIFPDVPKNSSMKKEEINQFIDLPEDISKCMSTESLLQTCLAYPQLGLIDAGSSPQMGYNLVSSIFRGLRELSTRTDRAESLLTRYKAVDPLGYNANEEILTIGKHVQQISYLEIILSQTNNLRSFNLAQKIELVELTRTVYERKKKDLPNYGLYRLATTVSVLARLMMADQYKLFLDAYKPNDQNWDVVDHYWSTNYATTEIVYSLSEGYLTFLKQQK